MAVDVDEVFRRGGRELIELLEYCVKLPATDVLFVHLVALYRLDPVADKALALWDAFCAADGAIRLKGADAVLPPRDARLGRVLAAPLEKRSAAAAGAPAQPAAPPARLPKYLFDDVVTELERGPDNALGAIAASYDASLSPEQNLPGGKMTPQQHIFVDKVWRQNARPGLVAGGFWTVANVAC